MQTPVPGSHAPPGPQSLFALQSVTPQVQLEKMTALKASHRTVKATVPGSPFDSRV